MVVEYPDRKKHDIEVKKVQLIEKDGTYLIHGREKGRSVVLHMKKNSDGSFSKIPETPEVYFKLQLPLTRKKNVTKVMKSELESSGLIGSTEYEEERKKNPEPRFATATKSMIIVYVDEMGFKYVTAATAYDTRLSDRLTKEQFLKALDSSPNLLDVPLYHLTDEEVAYLEKNYEIEYRNVAKKTGRVKNDEPLSREEYRRSEPVEETASYMERKVSQSLKALKVVMTNHKPTNGYLQKMLLFILNRNASIMSVKDQSARDSLLVEQYHDIDDIKDLLVGRIFPEKLLQNFEHKITSLIDYCYKVGIDYTMMSKILYDLYEKLQNKYERTGSLAIEDLYEIFILIDGITITLTNGKDNPQEELDSYLTNNAHYHWALNRLSGMTK